MKIRSFKTEDTEKCRYLWKELTQHHRDIYQNQSIGGDNPGLLFDEHLLKVGNNNIWVAESQNVLIGMVGLEKINDEYYVEPLIVDPTYQKTGIGKKLMQYIIEKGKEMDLKSLSVKSVMRNVEAINFYNRLGFNKIGFIELFMTLNETSQTKWKGDLEIFGSNFEY